MREITSHKVNGLNEALTVEALDEPGSGGASHVYRVASANRSMLVQFQNGPIAEHGVNGISQEALLAIVADRLECFQTGPYACAENAMALTHVKLAMGQLASRTKDRTERGVEGTSKI